MCRTLDTTAARRRRKGISRRGCSAAPRWRPPRGRLGGLARAPLGAARSRPRRSTAPRPTARPARTPATTASPTPTFARAAASTTRANGFDPTEILRDFDYGKTRRLASGRVLREWEIVAQDREIEVAPGVKYEAWTYNGRVPGPTLRAREGERLRIRFVNGSEHPHTMHFHGIHPALMDGMPGIGEAAAAARSSPARAFTYEFDAEPFGAPPLPLPRRRRSPPTSPAASTAPSSSTRSRAGPKPTRW